MWCNAYPPCVLSKVLAVHSHCPLSEFVSRMPRRLLVVSLPCCGQCGVVEGVEGTPPAPPPPPPEACGVRPVPWHTVRMFRTVPLPKSS